MIDPKETHLIKQARKGDTRAYAELIHTHSKRVFSICFGMVGHRQDAEDLAQQTLIKGFKHLRHLKKSQSFGPWISQVARNLCVDHHRKNKRQKKSISEYAKAKPLELTTGHSRDTDFSGLLNAIQTLKPEDRTALSLYYFEGQSTHKVALQLDTSESTLLVRLSRARKKLRALLTPEGGVL